MKIKLHKDIKRPDNKKTPSLEYILWADHWTAQRKTWYDINDDIGFDPILIHSVGWVLQETKEALFLASQLGENEMYGSGATLIMKGVIKKRIKL